ncbi:hypothetical protein [Bradyrhizobium forestalis]|uniref:hypothetical protein n=1 Tax=Bradyrhizobium forestalis TaxID=1419263 RepID=UPI0011AF609B|nr:hypothetical protein [Bradyrhizobium forestalis]
MVDHLSIRLIDMRRIEKQRGAIWIFGFGNVVDDGVGGVGKGISRNGVSVVEPQSYSGLKLTHGNVDLIDVKPPARCIRHGEKEVPG